MNKKFLTGLLIASVTAIFISGCASDSSQKSATDALPTPATPPPGAPAPASAARANSAPVATPAPASSSDVYSPAPAGTAPSTAATASTSSAPVATEKYTVKSGDSLWKIARDHKTSVAKLKELNHLSVDVIRAGDELLVPVKQ